MASSTVRPLTDEEMDASSGPRPLSDEEMDAASAGAQQSNVPDWLNFLQTAGGAIESFGKGETLGYLPKIQSAVEPAMTGALNVLTGQDVQVPEASQRELENYQRQARFAEQNPALDIGAQLAGGVATMPVLNPAMKAVAGTSASAIGAGLAGSKLATGALGAQNIPKVAGALAKGADLAKQGALMGAISDTGPGEKTLGETLGARAEQAATGAVMGPVVGGAIEGGVAGAKALGKGVASVGKKIFGNIVGLRPETISEYMKSYKRIREAPTLEEMKTSLDDTIALFDQDVERAGLNKAQSKERAESVLEQVKRSLDESVLEGKSSVMEARSALRDFEAKLKDTYAERRFVAREELSTATGRAKEISAGVKDQLRMTPGAQEQAQPVLDSIEALKQKVIEGSGKSWETLEQSSATFPRDTIQKHVRNAINSLKVGGEQGTAIGSASQQAIASLEALSGQVEALPKDLKMSQLKQIIQQLDRDTKWGANIGAFSGDAAEAEKKMLRRALDEAAKAEIPEYATAMQDVSRQTRLLSEASKKFGKPDTVRSRLQALTRETAGPEMELLRQLEQETGGDFTRMMEEYIQAQKTLRDPAAARAMERAAARKAGVPEAQARLKALDPLYVGREIEQAVAASPEAARLKAREAILQEATAQRSDLPFKFRSSPESLAVREAEAGLEAAKATREGIGSLSKEGTENAIKSMMRATPPIEMRKKLEVLGARAGKDYVQQIADMGIMRQFQEGRPNGSRNTLLWSLAGGAFGAPGGVAGGAGGMATGAAIGHYMDKYGPAVGKKILDGVIALGETDSAQSIGRAIGKMQIPEPARQDLYRLMTLSGIRFEQENKNKKRLKALEDK